MRGVKRALLTDPGSLECAVIAVLRAEDALPERVQKAKLRREGMTAETCDRLNA